MAECVADELADDSDDENRMLKAEKAERLVNRNILGTQKFLKILPLLLEHLLCKLITDHHLTPGCTIPSKF